MQDGGIPALLASIRSVAVVGWSAKAERPSHWIADYLEREASYRVYRVNPAAAATPELPVWDSLDALPEVVDVVDVFRAPAQVLPLVEEAARHGARIFWMQPGAENPAAAAAAHAAGMTAVLGECLYARHKVWRAGGGAPD